MRPTTTNPALPAAPPRRRRWPWRLFVVAFLFLGVPAAYYFYSKWSLEADIDRALAETDAADPRWRLAEIEADRKVVRDEDNSALHAVKVVALMGKGANQLSAHKQYSVIFDNLPPAAQLNAQQLQLLRDAFETLDEARIEARKFKNMPTGRHALVAMAGGFDYLLNSQADLRRIYDLLRHDAMMHAQQGDPDAAIESSLAILNAARSLGDEPFLTSMLIRRYGLTMVMTSLERTLAQGQPSEALLKELQDRLPRERDDLRAHWTAALRGDRALFHELLHALRTGKVRLAQHMETVWRMRITLRDRLTDYLPSLAIKDYAEHLRYRNELVAASRLPIEEQLDRFNTLAEQLAGRAQRTRELAEVLPIYLRDVSSVCKHHLTGQAHLAAMEAALACERYRLAHKRWPESLTELVKTGFLAAVPTDPFDGRPLRLARTKDGIVVYSVGEDKQDNGGNIPNEHVSEHGADLGFRLFDVDRRRQPPRPQVDLPAVD